MKMNLQWLEYFMIYNMTVQELKDFLDYCDPNASIIIIDSENDKSYMLSEIDVDYLVSRKLLRIDI